MVNTINYLSRLSSIVEIYLSKSKGLIWYIMKNGLETKRAVGK